MAQEKITCTEVGKLVGGKWEKLHDISRRVYSVETIAPTLHCSGGGNTEVKILVKEATQKGYAEARPGDSINIAFPDSKTRRGRVGHGIAHTIMASETVQQVIVEERTQDMKSSELKRQLCNSLLEQGLVEDGDVIRHSYTNNKLQKGIENMSTPEKVCPTLDTRCDCLGVCQDYRIRKLTERECFRLMGVKDRDFERVAKKQSTSSLYHLAGDSIVTTCLMAIFGELFQVDYRTKINELVEELKQ